jgi:hypothetical protein
LDPLTLFALANGAVQAVKKGCELYKEIKGAAGDVKDILKDLDDQFANKFKDRQPTVAERNQFITEKNRIIELNKKGGETTNIYTEIGQHLGTYFDNYYKCLAVFEEEERRSRTEVYHGEDSLGKRALMRVLLKKQLEHMSAELREIMVYQSPPELGPLYLDVEEMMKKVGKEQSIVIAAEMRRTAEQKKIRARRKKRIQYKILCWSSSTVAILYLIWLIWAVVQIRMEHQPELGTCLVPKGTWPYEHYNNLRWVDCEPK